MRHRNHMGNPSRRKAEALRRRGPQDLREEVERYRGLSWEEHDFLLQQACLMAAEQLDGCLTAERFLAWQDPLPESSAKLLKSLSAGKKKNA